MYNNKKLFLALLTLIITQFLAVETAFLKQDNNDNSNYPLMQNNEAYEVEGYKHSSLTHIWIFLIVYFLIIVVIGAVIFGIKKNLEKNLIGCSSRGQILV